MSDIAKPAQPGKENAHNGNVTGNAPRPAGQELATVKNADLARDCKTDLAR